MYYKPLLLSSFVLYILFFSSLCCVAAQDTAAFATDSSALGKDYSNECNADNTYDYIVVGVGQTGSIISSRLAQAGYEVFGIETGGPTHRSLGGTDYVASDFSFDSKGNVVINTPLTRFDVPNFFSTIYNPPAPYPDWRFIKNGNDSDAQVGKLLGGSGAHNGMIWLRFTKDTIDSWNVTGWKYDDLLPIYKRMENVTGSAANDPTYHGFSGPIMLSDTPNTVYYNSIPTWLQSCNKTGLPLNGDFNGASRLGCGTIRLNIRQGIRSSTAQEYLPKGLKTGKLELSLYSQATKVLLKMENSHVVAYGVEYIKNGTTHRAFANKEVVLTASAIFTPKLLMLSGIGPKADLARVGIQTVVNSPNVGKRLQANHIMLGSWEYPNATLPNGLRVAGLAQEYAFNKTGPFNHTGTFGYSFACWNTSKPCLTPDYMAAYQTGGFATAGAQSSTVSIQCNSHNPKVRANLTLTSSDPLAPPSISIDDYGNPDDVRSMVACVRRHRQIFSTPPASYIFGKEISPGAQYQTDQQIADWLKVNARVGYHWVSSTKVGSTGDPLAVVDTQLRVLGVGRLRVGDAGVLPSTNSHSQATAALAGERCADFLLGKVGV